MMKNPMEHRVHEFRIIVIGGMLLSLNCGFLNGATVLRTPSRTTTHMTGNATSLGIAFCEWNVDDIILYGGLILFYILGSGVAGILTPSKKFSTSNRYGTVLTLAAIMIFISSLIAILEDEKKKIYNIVVAASAGIQNGMLSRYSGNIIRVGHVTGAVVDIGWHTGRYLMGATEVLWKLKILLGLVFCFWWGGAVLQWVEPLMDDKILLVNVAYMFCLSLSFVVYRKITNFDKLEQNEGNLNDGLIINVDPPNAFASNSHIVRLSGGSDASSFVVICETDDDFNLTQEDIDRLHVDVRKPSGASVICKKDAEPLPLQDRDGKELTLIMICASVLALHAGSCNAISKLSTRELYVSHVTGAMTRFAVTAFSFDDSTTLMESTVIILCFTFGSCLVGLMSSTSVFRLGISYCRAMCLASILFIAGGVAHIINPGAMYYYVLAAVGCGVQNGMITKYSGGVIRTTNVTGSCADIGAIIGRMLKNNFGDVWQLKVLLPLVCSFICGGALGKFLSDTLDVYAPLADATLMVVITALYLIFLKKLSGTSLSYLQLITGKYTYPEIKKIIRETVFSPRGTDNGSKLAASTTRLSNIN